jgi:uncharacterized membrane protein YcaP (DUF421 family)
MERNMREVFSFGVPPGEIILRGTLVYWFLLLLFRFVLRRDTGSVGLADILVVVLIADAAQNAMAGEYKTVSEGFVLMSTIAGWNYLIDWLSYRFKWFQRFASPRPVSLIRNGVLVTSNLRREMITQEELGAQLRQEGVEDLKEVKSATIEPDGNISVVKYKEGENRGKKQKQRQGA